MNESADAHAGKQDSTPKREFAKNPGPVPSTPLYPLSKAWSWCWLVLALMFAGIWIACLVAFVDWGDRVNAREIVALFVFGGLAALGVLFAAPIVRYMRRPLPVLVLD